MTQRQTTFLILFIVLMILLGAGAYWYFFMYSPTQGTGGTTSSTDGGFSPFGRPGTTRPGGTASSTQTSTTTISLDKIPALRLLSATPIGGYGASTTATTTFVRWVDRGRGNILQARGDDLTIETLSNTILPYVYESAWSKDLKLFIGSILETDRETVSVVSTQLAPRATSTTGSQTPFELRGKNLPENTVAYVFSPKKDKIFLYVIENGRGVGYITNTSGSNTTQIFTTPITAVQAEWPEENTITITTNGTANESGFLYFVSPKTGIWKKIMGPVTGLTTRTSHTAGFVVYSYTGARNDVLTGIFSVASSTGNDAVVRTLADKCAWGNKYKELVYCAVPFQPVSGVYPDDWYRGSLSTVDKLWQINARTGEVHLISTLFTEAKQAIDAFNISIDDKDDFLYFMNKNNLSFWSYDLVVGSK